MSEPERLRPIIAACLSGEVAPVMGFMRLLMKASEAGEVDAALAGAQTPDAAGRERLDALRRLARDNPNAFANGSVDLVLAADSFPYIVGVDLSLAAAHLAEAARVLRPGGTLLVLNFSYRGDRSRDRDDFARLAGAAGLRVEASGETPFRLWDGTLFQAGKP